jgi:hypothetical protein
MGWDLFGTERRQAWASFAASVGGTFEPGALLKPEKLVAPFGGWRVHIDLYDADTGKGTNMKTRAVVELGGRPRVELYVRRSSILDPIADWLSTPEVTVGDAPFDAAFHIRCSDAAHPAAVLTPPIRAALLGLRQPTVSVEPERNVLFVRHPSRVRVEVDGIVKEVEPLRALWMLTVELAESLASQGVVTAP